MSRMCAPAVAVLSALCFFSACGGPPNETDAGAPDGGRDAGPPCSSATDCDDGLVCNGLELCTARGCAAGAPMRCDDGIGCTVDACSEALAACVHRVPDVDGDGAGDATCVDGTGTPLGDDCDDADPGRFAGNVERCDAAHLDEDCVASTLGGRDDDGDGFVSSLCCVGATCGDDCDDTRASVHVGATEVCNGLDDDCSGDVDEGVSVPGFVDADRDGYGDPSMPRTACGTAVGFSPYDTDCDDANAAVHPGQPEICDGIDNDCDVATAIDEGAAAVPWYRDADGDGFGTPTLTTTSCAPPVGYAILGTDCDDTRVARSPASPELCNGIDDDCSGSADFVIAPGDLEDDDRDGVPDAACADPRARDCDDHDPTSGPGALESCDGRDNDCDTHVDEGATEVVFYRDADGDGFGASTAALAGCVAPAGYTTRGGDCDDASTARFPGALETCNAIDDDCDVATDEGSYASASCPSPHGTSVCSVGTCRVVACDGGYADCSATTPGCESDILSDTDHCGGCRPCAGGACVNGTCIATCTPGDACATTNPCAWGTCGSTSSCTGGTVISCTPIRLDGHTSATTARAGTATGGAVTDTCAPGHVAIGLQANVDEIDGHLFALSLVCADAGVTSGSVSMAGLTVVPALGRGAGSSTGTIAVASCSDGTALSGAEVHVDARGIVGLRAHCVSLVITGGAAAGDFALSIAASAGGGTVGDTSGATAIDCASGAVGTGMTVTASASVTSLQLSCGVPTVGFQTTAPVLGASVWDVWDCPPGQLPISFTGDSTISSFYDDTLMEARFGCGALSVTADGHGGWTTSVAATGGALLPAAGGIGCCYGSHQPIATTTCPPDQVIVGMSGTHGNWGPTQVVLQCAPLIVTGDAASGFTVRYGTPTAQAPIGTGGGLPAVGYPRALCPQGTVGIGWTTGSGEVLGAISLRCGPPRIGL